MLTIGKLARQCQVNVETIRYYQRIGLLRTPPTTTGQYRSYQQTDVDTLLFIQRAKDAGLQLSEISELLQLPLHDRENVRRVVQHRLQLIDERIQQLQQLKLKLGSWISECEQTQTIECPILLNLKQDSVLSSTQSTSCHD